MLKLRNNLVKGRKDLELGACSIEKGVLVALLKIYILGQRTSPSLWGWRVA